MTLSTLEIHEDSSPLLANALPSFLNGRVPLHVNVEPHASSKSSELEKLSLVKDPSPTRVVVRIRPLGSTELDAGEKCSMRPLLANANPWDRTKSSYSNKRILSPSTSQLNRSTSRDKLLQANKAPSQDMKQPIDKTSTPTTLSTSLILGTEKEELYDFDQVIGPQTTQEHCYETLIGDLLHRNVKLGKDTSIVVTGPKKSGKTYTMHGDWKLNSRVGENIDCKNSLVETAGIVPRAVHDLFEASKEIMREYKSAVFMAFYIVAYEGGYTRDLLSRVEGKVKEVIKGVSYVHVDSPPDVQQLMDRASERLASGKEKGRKFHMFTSFRICRRTKGASNWQVSSKVTLVNLTTSPSQQLVQQWNQRNLRDLLQTLSIPPEGQNPDSARRFGSLRRRLDDALLGVTSTLLIACLSPIESELETSMDFLHICTLARGAIYYNEEPGSSWRSISTTSLGDQSNFSSEAGESSGNLSLRQQQALRQVTMMNTSKGSASLNLATTNCKSQRNKLSRASTVAALSLMATMTATKGEQNASGVVVLSRVPEASRRRGKVDSVISPRTIKNVRYSRRNGPRLLRENEKLKSEVGRLRKESRVKGERIKSLEDELELVSTNLSEERQISSKLESIRDLLKRKVILQEQRILILEQQKTMPPQDCHRSPDSRSSTYNLQNFCSPVRGECNLNNETTTSQDGIVNLSGNEGNDFNVNLLASLDESVEGDAIYLSGDDTGSADSRPCLSYVQSVSLASGWSRRIDTNASGLESLDDVTECGCQRTFLTSEYRDKIEFYVPRLKVSCLCGRQQLKISSLSEDLVRIETIFRPWQSEFLNSIGIFEVDHFIEMHHQEEKKLVRKLRKWRNRKELEVMSKISCAVALRVWARACLVAIRCRGGSVPIWSSGEQNTNDFLDVSSMGSSIGF